MGSVLHSVTHIHQWESPCVVCNFTCVPVWNVCHWHYLPPLCYHHHGHHLFTVCQWKHISFRIFTVTVWLQLTLFWDTLSKFSAICCFGSQLPATSGCNGFGIWNRLHSLLGFGDSLAVIIWKQVFITECYFLEWMNSIRPVLWCCNS